MSELYYLKPNIMSQPLINQWYAWSFLIAPQCASMVIAFSHIPIMNSYIAHPDMHEQALTIPELKGGQFIDLPKRDTDAISQLLALTQDNCSMLIGLAHSIHALFDILDKHPNGSPLEELYEKLPIALQGYIELVYDLQNQKSFRFIERMIYNSHYSTRPLQSVVLSKVDEDKRPFLLSTPCLRDPEKLPIDLHFGHEFYDYLYQTKTLGINEDALKALFAYIPNTNPSQFEFFKSFFTTDMPIRSYETPTETQINIKYYGHACVLIQSAQCSILIDPIISYQVNSDIDRFTYADLPETIDYLVFTHAHQDHVLIEHVLQLRHKTQNVIVPRSNGGFLQDPSLKIVFEELGFNQVIEIDDLESISIPNGTITGIPFLGEHGDLHIQSKKAHLITLFNKKILCAADSNNICPDLYQKLHPILGSIDVLFIGMECEGAPVSWVYGVLFPKKLERKYDQSRRLGGSDCKRALSLVEITKPKRIFVYAMALEPWLSYVLNINYNETSIQLTQSREFIDICANTLDIPSELLYGKREFLI